MSRASIAMLAVFLVILVGACPSKTASPSPVVLLPAPDQSSMPPTAAWAATATVIPSRTATLPPTDTPVPPTETASPTSTAIPPTATTSPSDTPSPTPTMTAGKVELVGHLGGAIHAMVVRGDYAYVGGRYGFNVLDVSDPSRPIQVSYLRIPVLALEVIDSYAYIAGGSSRLRVVDISNPLEPSETDSCSLPGVIIDLATLSSADNTRHYAFAVSRGDALTILDISEPTDCTVLGSLQREGLVTQFLSIHTSDSDTALHRVYLETSIGWQIIDVSDPANPKKVGSLSGWSGYLAVIDQYAYVASLLEGTGIVDISDPANPVEVGHHDFHFHRVSKGERGYLYATRHMDGLGVIDVSDPARPAPVASSTPNFNFYAFEPDTVTAAGDYVYAVNEEGLYILDVSDPRSPVVVGFYDSLTAANDLVVSDGYAYIARGVSYNSWNLMTKLSVVDVSDPSQPVQAGMSRLHWPAYRIEVAHGHAYVGQAHCSWSSMYCDGGLSIFDVSNPTSILEMNYHEAHFKARSRTGISAPTDWAVTDVKVLGQWIYLTGTPYQYEDSGGLQILRMPDYVTPIATTTITAGLTAEPWNPYALDVAECNQTVYAYLADYDLGLRIIDLSSGSEPAEVGFYALQKARDVVVVGQYAYLGHEYGIQIIDVSDPANPWQVGSHATGGKVWQLAVRDSRAYVAVGDKGLRIVDISDPANPVHVTGYDTLGSAKGVAFTNGYIYIANDYGGLVILRLR